MTQGKQGKQERKRLLIDLLAPFVDMVYALVQEYGITKKVLIKRLISEEMWRFYEKNQKHYEKYQAGSLTPTDSKSKAELEHYIPYVLEVYKDWYNLAVGEIGDQVNGLNEEQEEDS